MLIVVVARYITTVAIIAVTVLVALLIVGRPLFAVLGTISLLAVRTIAVVFFVIALTTLLTRGTVFLIGK